jgi:hypothetical protein
MSMRDCEIEEIRAVRVHRQPNFYQRTMFLSKNKGHCPRARGQLELEVRVTCESRLPSLARPGGLPSWILGPSHRFLLQTPSRQGTLERSVRLPHSVALATPARGPDDSEFSARPRGPGRTGTVAGQPASELRVRVGSDGEGGEQRDSLRETWPGQRETEPETQARRDGSLEQT